MKLPDDSPSVRDLSAELSQDGWGSRNKGNLIKGLLGVIWGYVGSRV